MKEFYCTFEINGVGHEVWINDKEVTVCDDNGLDVTIPEEGSTECKAFRDYLMQRITSAKQSGHVLN